MNEPPPGGTSSAPAVSKPMSEAEFLEAHSAAVYNLSLRLVSNPVEAEDLAQDSLLRALKALPSFRGDSSISTWLYRITVNTWKNRVRSQKRRGFWKAVSLQSIFTRNDEDDGASLDDAFAAPDPALDSELQKGETARQVEAALRTLDEDARVVVVLRDIEGLSYKQIAETLGIPEGTVKSKISRARDSLKETLARYAAEG